MLKIRLARYGKKQEPHYRIVVAEAKSRRQGRGVAMLGYWNVKRGEVKIDRGSYEAWVKKGAEPTEAVRQLVQKQT